MKHKLFLFTITMAAVVGSLVGSVFFVSAELNIGGTKEEIETLNKEITSRKDRIKQLEEAIAGYKKDIVKKQTEAVSLKNQLSILDSHAQQVQTDIELTKEKIKQAQLEIESLQLLIADKEKSIVKQKKIIAKMVQNIHSSDQKNYLEIMLTYNNFGDFYDELKYTESVYVDLGRSVKALRLAKEDLDAKKAQVEKKRKLYEDLKLSLEDKKSELNDQVSVKARLLVDTKASEAKYQTLLSSLRQQYQVIEGEVRTFEDKVRKKLEEEEKIKITGSVAMDWPTPSHHINALFHDPSYPYRRVFEHSGLDVRAAYGTAIRAAAAGYVARARRCSAASCYSYILIVHTGSISTVYGHLSNIVIQDDQFVNKGDIIGYSGGTPGTVGAGPFVTGPHLHFEVRLNGIPVDPLGYLTQ